MNYEQANTVKPYALDCYNAIKTIAGERKCGECKGEGKIWFANYLNPENCSACSSTGKVKYVWNPQVGEFAIRQPSQKIDLVTKILFKGMIRFSNEEGCFFDEFPNRHIPILDWEELEKILEGVGYYMSLPTKGERSDLWVVGFSRFSFKGTNKEFRYYKDVDVGRGKSRQGAVMKAVIEMRKKLGGLDKPAG